MQYRDGGFVHVFRKVAKRDTPPEICREILTYLPAKSLLRFRSVSKTWKFIIEDLYFANLHLRRCTNKHVEPSLILQETVCGKSMWVLRCSKTFRILSVLNFPIDDFSNWGVIGALNGVLLLRRTDLIWRSESEDVILWNPSIKKSRYIPPPPPWARFPRDKWNGFLKFDQSSNDYKIVCYDALQDFCKGGFKVERLFHVFSLKEWSWIEVCCLGSKPRPLNRNKVFLRECIHWIILRYGDDDLVTLASLNLTTQKIFYTRLPVDEGSLIHRAHPIVLDGSFLGLLRSCSIWVLEGLSENMDNQTSVTWSRKYEMDELKDLCKPMYLKKDGVLLASSHRPSWNTPDTLYWYDLKNRKKNLAFSAIFGLSYVTAHVESLVLLN